MISKTKFFISIFVCFSSFAGAESILHDISFSNIENTKKVSLSKKDLRVATNFHKLHKLSRKKSVSPRLLNKLAKEMEKSETFKEYIIWPKALYKINTIKRTSLVASFCMEEQRKNYETTVQKYLAQDIQRLCHQKFLQSLAEHRFKPVSFHFKYKDFFYSNIGNFTKNRNIFELRYLLSRFDKNNFLQTHYSNLITEYFISNNIAPPIQLLKNMYVSPRLTKHVQNFDLENKLTQRVFYKNFRLFLREILELSDKDPKSKEIAKKTTELHTYYLATFNEQPRKKILKSIIGFGKGLTRRGHYELARKTYQMVLDQKVFPVKNILFDYIWSYALEKKFDKAVALTKKYIEYDKELFSNSKLTFWVAFVNHQENNTKVSKTLFQELIKRNPLSYYAVLASKVLSKSKDEKDTRNIYLSLIESKKNTNSHLPASIDNLWLKRVMAWSHVYNTSLLKLELRAMKEKTSGHKLKTHLLSAAYKLSQSNSYLESFKVLYRYVENGDLDVNQDILKILFPLPYLKEIKSKTKNFDPIIALSLIRQESGFNRFAKSRVGARGLMQLMPNTAKRFKRRVRKRHLYNSKLNIDIGTRYFTKLLDRYDNNLVYSLAAYNAGESRVKDWKKRSYVDSEASMLENIENIPFPETQKYVKLIFRNIFFYKMLMESPIKKDTTNFNQIYDIQLGFNK